MAILKESQTLVTEAESLLLQIDPILLKHHLTKMVTCSILHTANESMHHFKEEGVVDEHLARIFFEKTYHDINEINKLSCS